MLWVTVGDMYNNVKDSSTKLLSNYSSDFWAPYLANSNYYDRLFKRMFGSFRYFDQEPIERNGEKTAEHIDDVQKEFTDAVYDHLLVNDKKYSELFRVTQINDDDYSIVNNYDVEETKEGTSTHSTESTYGSRTDTQAETLGASEDEETREYGERTDSSESLQGSQENARENGIAGFNSVTYADDRNQSETLGSRTDTADVTTGAHTDVISTSRGGKQNSYTNIKGQQVDSIEGSGTDDYTLHKVGNIGVKSISQMLQEHLDVWTPYEFYKLIFKEICAELLLI